MEPVAKKASLSVAQRCEEKYIPRRRLSPECSRVRRAARMVQEAAAKIPGEVTSDSLPKTEAGVSEGSKKKERSILDGVGLEGGYSFVGALLNGTLPKVWGPTVGVSAKISKFEATISGIFGVQVGTVTVPCTGQNFPAGDTPSSNGKCKVVPPNHDAPRLLLGFARRFESEGGAGVLGATYLHGMATGLERAVMARGRIELNLYSAIKLITELSFGVDFKNVPYMIPLVEGQAGIALKL